MMHLDYKATIWFRYFIDTEEDFQKVKEYLESNNPSTVNKIYENEEISHMLGQCEEMMDTEEPLTPKENKGYSTIELFNDTETVWSNEISNELTPFDKYILIHNFLYPSDKLKSWISEVTYTNHYVENWNALMLVIKKIKDLAYSDNNQKIIDWLNEIQDRIPDIRDTYEQIIKFIQWYNEQTT